MLRLVRDETCVHLLPLRGQGIPVEAQRLQPLDPLGVEVAFRFEFSLVTDPIGQRPVLFECPRNVAVPMLRLVRNQFPIQLIPGPSDSVYDPCRNGVTQRVEGYSQTEDLNLVA